MSGVSIQVLIGCEDYASYVDLESLTVDNNVIMTSDSASCLLYLPDGVPRPRAGMEFIWRVYDEASNYEVEREFGGVIVAVSEEVDGPLLVYRLTVKSYIHWFDRHLVVAWYNQDEAASIVKKIVNQFCPGFTTDNVQSTVSESDPNGITVIPQYFNYQKASDAVRMVADQLHYGWYVDYFKDVHFYPAEFFISPLPGNVLDVENDYLSYGDLALAENGEQTINKVFIRGFKSRSGDSAVLSFPGDGVTEQWSLGYRVSSFKDDFKVAVFPSLAALRADTSFASTGVATMGTQLSVLKDSILGSPDQKAQKGYAYVHYTQHLLRIPNYNGSKTPVPTGSVVGVFFYYLKDQVFLGQDVQSQGAISQLEGTDGIYEYAYEDKSLTNSTMDAVKAKAELVLRKYGKPQLQGSFTSYSRGWRAGQYFMLRSSRRMGGINSVAYVHRVRKQLIRSVDGEYLIRNTVEFADSPYLV